MVASFYTQLIAENACVSEQFLKPAWSHSSIFCVIFGSQNISFTMHWKFATPLSCELIIVIKSWTIALYTIFQYNRVNGGLFLDFANSKECMSIRTLQNLPGIIHQSSLLYLKAEVQALECMSTYHCHWIDLLVLVCLECLHYIVLFSSRIQ